MGVQEAVDRVREKGNTKIIKRRLNRLWQNDESKKRREEVGNAKS